MKAVEFMKYGTHLCNFNGNQLIEIFDWNEVRSLRSTPAIQESIRMLSQFLCGNQIETAEEILDLSPREREVILLTWTEVVKDADTLKSIANYVIKLH